MTRIIPSLEEKSHLSVGFMSGTAHDGVSAALVRIDERRPCWANVRRRIRSRADRI